MINFAPYKSNIDKINASFLHANITKTKRIAASLKYLSNFWRSHEMPLINYKVELKLTWTKCCVLSANSIDKNDASFNNSNFTIKDTKLYASTVTLSAKNNLKLIKLLSKGFERSVYWNENKKRE